MDNSESSQAPKQDSPKTKGRLLSIILVGLLVCSIAVGGWLYYNAHQTVQNQKSRISELKKELERRGIVVPVGDLIPEPGEADSPACAAGSEYSAEVGRFSIALSNPNVIIRALDGGFEGGPVTQLSIGRCIEDQINVVDTYPLYEIKILAHPSSDSATLRSNFEAQWGSPLTLTGTATVDGVTAQVYTGTGLFTTKLLYFDNAGIGYQVELTETNPTSEAILSDVVDNWSFTP